MSKVRVYELARDLGSGEQGPVDFLEDLGADIKNHMSTVEDDIAEMVREHFSKRGTLARGSRVEGTAGGEGPSACPGRPPTQSPERAPTAPPARGTKSPSVPKATEPAQRPPANAQRESAGPRSRGRGRRKEPGNARDSRFDYGERVCRKLGVPATAIIKTLMGVGVMAGINQSIEHEAAAMVAQKLGFTVERPQATQGTCSTIRRILPRRSRRGRPSSPSWATSTTARRRFSTRSAGPGSSNRRPAGSHSIWAHTRSSATAADHLYRYAGPRGLYGDALAGGSGDRYRGAGRRGRRRRDASEHRGGQPRQGRRVCRSSSRSIRWIGPAPISTG